MHSLRRMTDVVGKIRKHFLTKRVLCVCLAIIFTVGLLPGGMLGGMYDGIKAEGAAVTNSYILETTTGINDGSGIEFFEIIFTDTQNIKRKQYIFPNEDSLMIGRLLVAQYDSDLKINNEVSSYLKYDPLTNWDKTGDGSGLRSYHTDQFFFTTEYPVKSVDQIDAFMGDEGVWTCQGLRLFEVDEIYGLTMAGTWSETWYIDFAGTMIAEITNADYNWSDSEPSYLHMSRNADLVTDFKGKDYAIHESQAKNELAFRFDFADMYGAGFDTLVNEHTENKADLMHMGITENLTLNIMYTDIYDETRFLYLPVITEAVYWAYMKGITSPVLGIGQQGGSMAFSAELPDIKMTADDKGRLRPAITDISCTLGSKGAIEAAGIKETGFSDKEDLKKRQEKRKKDSESDDINLTCVAIYSMQQSAVLPKAEGAMLKYDFTGKPCLYQLATGTEGMKYFAGNTAKLSLKEYDERDLKVKDNNEYYMIELETDDMAGAGTSADLTLVLKYNDLSKRERVSSPISIMEATRNYYGYWPASDPDYGYKQGTASGNTIRFIVSLKDVDHFTGLTLQLAGNSSDDYQFKHMNIYELKSFSERKAVWMDSSKNGMQTHVDIYRSYEGTATSIKLLNLEEQALIQQGDIVPIDFISSKVGELDDTKWDVDKYSVSYADAMQNFGFTKERKTYEVTVKVFDDVVATDDYGNAVSSGGNGDAGSENLFYFQLIFQNGSSAYVQANQQLEGDKFVSGQSATFRISTNQDYGEIISIRIIPDDISERNHKYDKLRIDSIEVIEIASAGTHKCWVAENVGWIGVPYTEEQEKNGIIGKEGRSAAEVVHVVNIDYTTYVAQLEFAIHTNESTQDAAKDKNGNVVESSGQFRGKLWGKINYINLKGEHKEIDKIDIVSAMYEYMNKKSSPAAGGSVSDPSYMFREKQTDRFLVNISDVSKLISIEMYATQMDDMYTWNIGSISVSLVTEKGKLKLNVYGEYEYQRSKPAELLCTQLSETTPAYQQKLKKNGAVKIDIPFTDNEIKITNEYGTAISALTREPASQNDELNVFVFPSVGLDGNDPSEYDLIPTLYYSHLNGGMYETGVQKMNRYLPDGTLPIDRPVFYAVREPASCMTDLNRLILAPNSPRATVARIDYAIVQQVRNNVVVANYFIDYGHDNAFMIHEKYPSTNVTSIGYQDEQVVTLQFGEATAERNLVAERQDIAVALVYRTAGDPSGTKLVTPYIYLTDQEINSIRAGQVAELVFDRMFIGEVVGVRVASVGNIEANIDAASVAIYQKDVVGSVPERAITASETA